MIILVTIILLLITQYNAFAQTPLSHQNWNSATISSGAITVDCAPLLLPIELGRLLSEENPTVSRGEMDKSLRSSHPTKISLQPESGTADDLTNITGCTTNGARIQLSTTDTGDTITVVHTPGTLEFFGGGNVTLSSPLQILTLQRKGGIWVSEGMSSGGGGGGGILEQSDCSTATAIGDICVDTDTGHVYRGTGTDTQPLSVLYHDNDCSPYTSIAHLCLDTDDGHLYRGDGTVSHRISVIHQAADCLVYNDIGELCIDSDDGLLYRGDGSEAGVIGAGTAGSQGLDDVFDIDKVIDGANSQANAVVISNGTDGFRIYNNIIECFQGADTCDIAFDIPTGKSLRVKYAGVEGIVINSSGQATLNNNMIEYKSYSFGAGSLSTDGTNCTDATERVINGGPKTWVINCGDNAGSVIYGSATMRDAYNGGQIFFLLEAENENATPSGVLEFEFSAMCRSDGDKIYDAATAPWGAAMPSAITFTAQYNQEMFWTGAVTPHGTCQAGDKIYWRAVMDPTATTTQVANMYITGVKMEFPTNKWSE